MIVSHKHKFIFIKTKKTAGTSLAVALSAKCGPSDIVTRIGQRSTEYRTENNFVQAQNYEIQRTTNQNEDKIFTINSHAKASVVKNIVGDDVWNEYFKFCFDRNPFEKFISYYFWKQRKKKQKESIEEFISSGEFMQLNAFDQYTIDGLVAVDKIYKLEEMDEALVDINNRLNFKEPLKLPSIRFKGGIRKNRQPYHEFLSQEVIKTLSVIYAREIRLLNY